jgi:hypothetical protein
VHVVECQRRDLFGGQHLVLVKKIDQPAVTGHEPA